MSLPRKNKNAIHLAYAISTILAVAICVFCVKKFILVNTPNQLYEEYFKQKLPSGMVVKKAEYKEYGTFFGSNEGHHAYFWLSIPPDEKDKLIRNNSYNTIIKGSQIALNLSSRLALTEPPEWFLAESRKAEMLYTMENGTYGLIISGEDILFFDFSIQ